MTKHYFLFLMVFLTVKTVQSQNGTILLKGKVSAKTDDLEGISIINIQTDYTATTTKGGYFEIYAKIGESLVFSGVQFDRQIVVVTDENSKQELFNVNLKVLVRTIEEVVIDNKINSVSLGIVSKNQKKYTVAERRLYTASGGINQFGTSTSVSLDNILNMISGRTAMLQKELVNERKEIAMRKLSNWFDDTYFTERLKIPLDYIDAFKYFSVEDEKLMTSIRNKNKTLTAFLLGEVAVKYLKVVNEK